MTRSLRVAALAAALLPAAAGAASAEPAPLNVLIFWSTNCSNCEGVLRQLQNVRNKLRGAPVRFYAVTLDNSQAQANVFLHHHGLWFDTTPANRAVSLVQRYRVTVIPWVVITRCDGSVAAVPSRDNTPRTVPAYVEMELVFHGMRPLPARRVVCDGALDEGA